LVVAGDGMRGDRELDVLKKKKGKGGEDAIAFPAKESSDSRMKKTNSAERRDTILPNSVERGGGKASSQFGKGLSTLTTDQTKKIPEQKKGKFP